MTVVLVCGSRDWEDRDAINQRIAELPEGSVVIQGGARGADIMARHAAVLAGLHWAEVPAQWHQHGKRAGVIRNRVMLDLKPELVIAFQCNGSRGTQHTIDEARRRGIPVEVIASGPQEPS